MYIKDVDIVLINILPYIMFFVTTVIVCGVIVIVYLNRNRLTIFTIFLIMLLSLVILPMINHIIHWSQFLVYYHGGNYEIKEHNFEEVNNFYILTDIKNGVKYFSNKEKYNIYYTCVNPVVTVYRYNEGYDLFGIKLVSRELLTPYVSCEDKN